MEGKEQTEGNVARAAATVTAVAVAIAALVALVPHDRTPAVSSTIQNVISVPVSTPAPVRQPGSPRAGTGDWSGGSSYTAVLASKRTEAQARAIQRIASDHGLDAGVLFSSRFRSLRPGYWVVFSGAYASADGASTRAQRARGLGFTEAYPRYVSR